MSGRSPGPVYPYKESRAVFKEARRPEMSNSSPSSPVAVVLLFDVFRLPFVAIAAARLSKWRTRAL